MALFAVAAFLPPLRMVSPSNPKPLVGLLCGQQGRPSPMLSSTGCQPRPVICSATRTPAGPQQGHETTGSTSNGRPILSSWGDFANAVSGEWDGHGADFTSSGIPMELPESVVPEAFRDWEVQVFDWQTQCPTLADPEKPILTYKMIKLLPTVGCEADAATRYSVQERVIDRDNISAFAYDRSGSYIAVWNLDTQNDEKNIELEYCLADPRDRETRVRIILALHQERAALKLQQIKVFAENWYGPFRNGEQLGGCAIREAAFASTGKINPDEVTGVWQSTRTVSAFKHTESEIIQELTNDRLQRWTRDQDGLVTLPKQLWCYLKNGDNGDSLAEVGWVLDHGSALSSKCVFSKGDLKEIALSTETAVLEDS